VTDLRLVVSVEAVYRALTNRLNRGVPLDEDLVWDAIHTTFDKLGLRRKSELILPMRHALTGRLVRVIIRLLRSWCLPCCTWPKILVG
jgi:hypothetical protein